MRHGLGLGLTSGLKVPKSKVFISRASIGTYYDSSGIVQTAAVNVARYQLGQLLLESAETNLFLHSDDLTNAVYKDMFPGGSTTSIVSSGFLAPDGNNTAFGLTGNGGTTTFLSTRGSIAGVAKPNLYFSVYAKAGTYTQFCLGSDYSGDEASFNLSTGVSTNIYGSQSSMLPLTNGWFRCQVKLNAASSNYAARFFLIYPGTFQGSTSPNTLYFWGPQLETGSYSSYFPSGATVGTRAADIFS